MDDADGSDDNRSPVERSVGRRASPGWAGPALAAVGVFEFFVAVLDQSWWQAAGGVCFLVLAVVYWRRAKTEGRP